jgi:hypothetical protein
MAARKRGPESSPAEQAYTEAETAFRQSLTAEPYKPDEALTNLTRVRDAALAAFPYRDAAGKIVRLADAALERNTQLGIPDTGNTISGVRDDFAAVVKFVDKEATRPTVPARTQMTGAKTP